MNKAYIYLLLIIFSTLISCQEVINVDLNDINPAIVIEGGIDNSGDPCIIKITRSINFDDTNYFPPVNNAIVILSDNNGVIDTLSSADSGKYVGQIINGIPGNTYQLSIKIDNQTYTSISKMPDPVSFDSVNVDQILWFGSPRFLITAYFTDPVGIDNYYRFVVYRKGKPRSSIYVYTDEGKDGTVNTPSFLASSKIESGDTIDVEMQCIDKNVYDYFFGLRQLTGTFFYQSASPANPESNILGGNGIGYFSAHTSERKTIIMP
jgi:hypothetical protein